MYIHCTNSNCKSQCVCTVKCTASVNQWPFQISSNLIIKAQICPIAQTMQRLYTSKKKTFIIRFASFFVIIKAKQKKWFLSHIDKKLKYYFLNTCTWLLTRMIHVYALIIALLPQSFPIWNSRDLEWPC